MRVITHKRVMFVSCSRTDGNGPDKVLLLIVLQNPHNKERFGGLQLIINFTNDSQDLETVLRASVDEIS